MWGFVHCKNALKVNHNFMQNNMTVSFIVTEEGLARFL